MNLVKLPVLTKTSTLPRYILDDEEFAFSSQDFEAIQINILSPVHKFILSLNVSGPVAYYIMLSSRLYTLCDHTTSLYFTSFSLFHNA